TSSRSDVGDIEETRWTELTLDADVPLLRVRGLEIALIRRRRRWDEDRKLLRVRIVDEQQRARQREEHPQIEERRIEVESFAGSEGRLIVIDPVAGADDGSRRIVEAPRRAKTRGPVVAIGLVAAARNAV